MRVLYGVNGEGMGHATRSRVVIEELLERHDVRVVASGAAFRYLSERLPRVDEVFGPSFAMQEGEIHRWQTVVQNVRNARRDCPRPYATGSRRSTSGSRRSCSPTSSRSRGCSRG